MPLAPRDGRSLCVSSKDKREYVYSREQLADAQTHDDLWNAAQVRRAGRADGSAAVEGEGFLVLVLGSEYWLD